VLIVLSILLAVGPASGWGGPLWPAMALLALFQAMAFFFNLLPVPGLDGYGVIRPFLPPDLQAKVAPVEKVAIFILIAVVFFVPGVAEALFDAALFLTSLLGVDTRQIGQGYVNFHFWESGGG